MPVRKFRTAIVSYSFTTVLYTIPNLADSSLKPEVLTRGQWMSSKGTDELPELAGKNCVHFAYNSYMGLSFF